MSIRDPKRFNKKIVTPAEAHHQAALGVQDSPVAEELERVKSDMVRMMQQAKATAIRLNAVMDYLGHLGLFLTQELDEMGFSVGEPFTPLECTNKIFEGLVDQDVISGMPEYGFDAFFVEHQKLSDMLIMLNQARYQGSVSMTEIIKTARDYNNDPKRITKIRGEQFGLVEYLNDNPGNLSGDDVAALGVEFGLNINLTEEAEDGGSDQAGAGTETETVQPGEDAQ